MDFSLAIFLGALQGLTEFLPVSSSGHILLAEHFFDLPVAELKAFDVILHSGTLGALLLVFYREIWGMLQVLFKFRQIPRDPRLRQNFQLLAALLVATIPAALIGLFGHATIDNFTRGENRVLIVGSFLLLTALGLWLAERITPFKTAKNQTNSIFHFLSKNPKLATSPNNPPKIKTCSALWIGFFQALALLPGLSRSGATIVAGMFFGLSREAATRFSFLLLIPAISGATLLTILQIRAGEIFLPDPLTTFLGFSTSFLTSLIVSLTFLKLVKKYPLTIFSWYLVLLTSILLFTSFN